MGGVCKFFENFIITSRLWGWHTAVEGYTACKHGRGSSDALFPILRELLKSSNLKILKYKLDFDQNMKVVKHIMKYLYAEFGDEKISFDWANPR